MDWYVFWKDKRRAIHVKADLLTEATAVARRQVPHWKGPLYPHMHKCGCEDITKTCSHWKMHQQLKGTPLGRVCRIAS
jgi:hypothetical protein